MHGGKCMAKQLDCTTSIESTQNYGIHGIHFGPHTTFSRVSHLASKQKPGLINISRVDWTTSKLNDSIEQIPYQSSSLNLISSSAMTVGLKMTHISSECDITEIFPDVSRFFWHISHFRRTSILTRCASVTLRVIESTARWTRAIGGGIQRINFLQQQQLWHSYVHPTRLTWLIFRVISMPGCWISR